jgi:hypothetical protein
MKRFLVNLAIGALAFGAAAQSAHAVAIEGGINFGMNAAPNTGSWATATAVTFGVPYPGFNASVQSASGTYAPVTPLLTLASYQDFTFSPALSPMPVAPLWSFSFGGRTYTFQLDTIDANVYTPSTSTRSLRGTGILRITGSNPSYDDTPSTWFFSGQGTQGQFSVSSSNIVPVPEPTALGLLGLGLLGLGFGRRRKA